jgi:transposase InsO family protein
VKSICKFLEIHSNSFTYWKKAIEVHYTNSPIGVCLKKVPSQVTLKEIQTIRELLNRKKFLHWPIASVWAYAVRNDLVRLSLCSWYRYNKKYKFRKGRPKFDKRKDYDPLRAERPNHTWHADITIVKTVDGLRNYVYLIVDNYSKLIINWKADKKCNGKIRTQTIREAILQEFGTDLTPTQKIDLIVDGGTENNNQTVEAYIKQSQVDITKKIALKDIKQSNSMVEASNKILKHQYLFKQPIADIEHLQEHLKEAVEDFNNQRPHYALGIYTPYEIQYDKKPELNIKTVKNAVKSLPDLWRERREMNKLNACRQGRDAIRNVIRHSD